MAEGIVMQRGSSKNGKPTITIDQGDGKASLYYAGNTDLAGLTAGDKISFTATSFANGKLWGIDKGWKLLYAAAKYPPVGSGPPAPIAAPSASGAGSNGITDAERPAISNWVAHAIAAGCIKEPEQIEKWVCASKNALRAQDSDIP